MSERTDWLRGCTTALVTPFDAHGAVDAARLGTLVERQVAAGVRVLLPCGTTGEAATLSDAEQLRVIETTIAAADGRARVVAGVGANCTAHAVERARAAAAAGVDGLLVVTPYYNKPTAAGLVAHFEAIAEAVPATPIVLYNVPGRTAVNLDAATALRIAREIPSVAAIKEASGSVPQITRLLAERRARFWVLAGDDALALPLIALGADGVVSVVSNEAPHTMRQLVDAALRGDFEEARRLHFELLPLMDANFAEASPGGVKAALALMGLIEEHLRLPLVPVGDDTRVRLGQALHRLHLLPDPCHAPTA